MKNEVAITENIKQLTAMLGDLSNRPMGVEGMGLVWGNPGEGKTTAIAWAVDQVNGVYVRARASWTPLAMLNAFAAELGVDGSKGSKSQVCDRIIDDLTRNPKMVFVDEADYLFRGRGDEMADTMRDIYDVSQSPIVLIGMEDMSGKIKNRPRLRRRIQKWVAFKPLEFKDVKNLTDTVCEVPIEHDLLADLHKKSSGNIGLITLGLEKLERYSKRNGIDPDPIGPSHWGDKPFFLTSKHGGMG